ncbi:MAG: hypothetical protein Roseis2KO_26580 [Roseivirga sp.]
MGYMGFGMRKEVYTRKPKKAFKKMKKPNTSAPEKPSRAGYDASKAYQQMRFKPIRERRWFKLLTATVVIFICLSVLNVTVFDELRYLKRKHDFEKAGVSHFYLDHKSSLDSLIRYVLEQNGKIAGIDGHKITFRSEDYQRYRKGRSEKAHHCGLDYFGRTIRTEIIQGNLKFPLHDFYRTFKEYWSCDVLVSEVDKLDSTFFQHLATDNSALSQIVNTVEENGLRVNNYEHGLVLSFDRFDHTYNLIYSDSISYFQNPATDDFHAIDKKLFWQESKLYSDIKELAPD